jgi:glycosyltransferase involved in cell wall biosynthesis
MKIAIIGSRGYPYVYSGYETFVKELAERLVQKEVEVTVYCHKKLFFSYPEKVNGIQLVYLPTIEKKSLSQLVHSFLSITHACFSPARPDVILAVNAANGPWGLITRLSGMPTLINVDGLEWLRPKWKGFGARYFRFSAWLCTRLYDRIITDAEEMRKVYLEDFQKDSTVIAYGANISYPGQPSLLNQFQLTPFEYYLVVGRLIPDNNAGLILREFMEAGSSKKLVIVGDVPYNDKYAASMKAKAGPDIFFLGYITNSQILAELYHHCFAYLHGHEFGGTNPTMLTAMASGCAIMALETRFNREMQQAEKNESDLTALRKKSRNGLTEKYNWDHITDEYISIFRELIKNKKES